VISAEEILNRTDWPVLEHAYGSAEELPSMLRCLLMEDAVVAGEVLASLDAAVLHQGTIYSSTAPAALFVGSILADERVGILCASALPWDDRVRPLRAALLEWLGNVAAACCDLANGADGDGGDEAELACRAIRPELYRAVSPFVWDDDPSVRAAAVVAVGPLLRGPDLAEFRAALAESLILAAPGSESFDRANLTLILDGWDIAPRALLSDPDPAVRAYAAAASTLDDDPDAVAELRAALRDPGAVQGWFGGHHPQRDGWFLTTLVRALFRRTTAFDEIEAEAMAIVAAPESFARTQSVGILWQAAVRPDVPDSPARRRFLEALKHRPST
jgi:hypothetical protein